MLRHRGADSKFLTHKEEHGKLTRKLLVAQEAHNKVERRRLGHREVGLYISDQATNMRFRISFLFVLLFHYSRTGSLTFTSGLCCRRSPSHHISHHALVHTYMRTIQILTFLKTRFLHMDSYLDNFSTAPRHHVFRD